MEQAAMSRAAAIEVLGHDGQVRWVHKVGQWPLRIGRSPECDLVLDDPHLAGEHALLDWDEAGERLCLQLQPSLNGGWLGPQAVQPGAPVEWPDATVLQLGLSRLRVRSLRQGLAPEKPLPATRQIKSWQRGLIPGLVLLWALLLWFDQWAALDPGTPWVDFVSPVLWPLGLLALWAAVWAMVTQLFRHWFAFAEHLKRALICVLALHLASMALPNVAYAFNVPRLMALDAMLYPVGLTLLLWWQARLVWPRIERVLGLSLGLMLLLGLGVTVAKRQDQQYWFGPNYLNALPAPQFRMASPKPPQALIEALRPLEAQLQRQAEKDNDGAAQDGAGGD